MGLVESTAFIRPGSMGVFFLNNNKYTNVQTNMGTGK